MTLDSIFARAYFMLIPHFSIKEYYEENIKRC